MPDAPDLDTILRDVPVFVLGAVLLPDDLLPLHVFEPRYRALVDSVQAGHGHFVVGTVDTVHSVADAPPVLHPTAGVGRILRHLSMEDGRCNLLLAQVATVRIEAEVTRADEPFRRLRCTVLPEPEADDAAVTPSLIALGAQVLGGLDLPEALDAVATLRGRAWLSAMARILLQQPATRLAWLNATTVARRAALLERVLVERLMARMAEGR